MPTVTFAPQFKRAFQRKPQHEQQAVENTIARLVENRAHPGLRVHKIRGEASVWEAYVSRSNRITFEWDGDDLILLNNCSHAIVERRQ